MPVSSLKTKMILAVSLLITVVLSLLAFSAFWYFERQFKDTISVQQFTLVSAMADAVDSKIQNAQSELVAVAARASSNLALNPRQARNFLDSRAGVRTVFDSGIFIFSPEGRLIAASPHEPHLTGRDYSFRGYIRKTIATGGPQISMPFFSSQAHHHPIIMFTAPFFDEKGTMAGIVAGALDLMRDNLLGKLANIKIGKNGYLYLYSTDRTMIVHPDRTRILRQDVPPGVNRLFDLAIAGFEGTGETVNSRGLYAVSSFKRIKSTNWILAANFPQSEAYAPIHRAKWYFSAALVVALVLSLLSVWWFMRYLTARLEQFTRHVKAINCIEDKLEPLQVTSSDEIGTLTHSFNEMLAELDEQKRIIREQKEFSENLLRNSAVPTFVLDSRHRVIIWNKACEVLTGKKASEVLGTADSWKAFYREERWVLADIVIEGNYKKLDFFYGSHNKSPFTPDGLQAEGWFLTSNGRQRYAFFDAAPVRNAAGEVIAVIQTVQDITERKRAEEELEFKNVILSTQQESSIDGILMVDESNTIKSCNRRFTDLWNIPPELVEAADDSPVLQLVASRVADPETFVARVNYLYEHREEKSRDEILLRDGRVFDRYSAPMLRTDGKYFGRVWYFRDISDRKRMEEALRESEERYRRLVEHSPEAIFIHTKGKFVFMNATGAKLLGAQRPEDLYGMAALDFVHPDYLEMVRQRIENAWDYGDNPLMEELLVRLDGSTVPVEMVSIHFNYQGMGSVLAIARDISERKKMQEELLKAQRLESLGVLAGGIAHDFNNILTGILGNLSLASARLDPAHTIARYLDDCEKAVGQASKLTRQLLTFARGGEPVKKLIDPASLIRETASFALRGSNVKSIIELEDDLWGVEADSGQLNQALHNILINAVQAMPGGGEVTVRAMNETLEPENKNHLPAGHYIRIVIEDRGCGIPSEHLARIFDPYFTTKPEGNGLGLASVYSIVTRHGGVVEVSSTMGVGSSLTIHLPALPGGRPETEVVMKEPELVGSGRILIMDDEELIREIASEILEYTGYNVESCADGKEAVELFRNARDNDVPFDAVILDLTIPGGMGGKEAASLMLEIDPHAVLIVSSGYSNDPVVANFRQYGFSGVVSKPFDAKGLALELDRLIRNSTLLSHQQPGISKQFST
jgi:two-component system cell cycle sensor histidine kinase/response regulator CckA